MAATEILDTRASWVFPVIALFSICSELVRSEAHVSYDGLGRTPTPAGLNRATSRIFHESARAGGGARGEGDHLARETGERLQRRSMRPRFDELFFALYFPVAYSMRIGRGFCQVRLLSRKKGVPCGGAGRSRPSDHRPLP